MRTINYNVLQQKVIEKIQEANDSGYTLQYKDNGQSIVIKLDRPKIKTTQEFYKGKKK